MFTIFRTSSGSLFQSSRGMTSLLIKTGARPLGQKQQRRSSSRGAFPTRGSSPSQYPPGLLRVDQFLGSEPETSRSCRSNAAAQSPGVLQVIEIIVFPLLAVTEILPT